MSDQQPAATPEEIEARVDMAFALLVKGYSQREAVDYMHKKTEWGAQLSKRWLREYCARAREELARMAAGGIDRREEHAKALMRLDEQYRKANVLNDTARATAAVNSTISLLKLDQPSAQMSWETNAAQIGIQDTERLAAIAWKLVQLATSAPDRFEQVASVIEGAYAQLTA